MPEIFSGKYLAIRVAAQEIQRAPVPLHPATPLHRAVPLLAAAGVMLREEEIKMNSGICSVKVPYVVAWL